MLSVWEHSEKAVKLQSLRILEKKNKQIKTPLAENQKWLPIKAITGEGKDS